MRSFSSRPDTAVLDEPFYAHYLEHTGIDHPGRREVIGAYETDWRKVVKFITGPIPEGKLIWYQKHMAHHMLGHIDVQRLVENDTLTHTFLIRHPLPVIASYTKVHGNMTLLETGLPYQADLFERVRKSSRITPPVIDARDLLIDPSKVLARLCQALGIEFTDRMLSWAAGPHSNDGNWGKHWYASVYNSTGFEKYEQKNVKIAPRFEGMLGEARKLYDQLAAHKL